MQTLLERIKQRTNRNKYVPDKLFWGVVEGAAAAKMLSADTFFERMIDGAVDPMHRLTMMTWLEVGAEKTALLLGCTRTTVATHVKTALRSIFSLSKRMLPRTDVRRKWMGHTPDIPAPRPRVSVSEMYHRFSQLNGLRQH